MSKPRPKSPYLIGAPSLSEHSQRLVLQTAIPSAADRATLRRELEVAKAEIRRRRATWEAGRDRVEVEPPVTGGIDPAVITALVSDE